MLANLTLALGTELFTWGLNTSGVLGHDSSTHRQVWEPKRVHSAIGLDLLSVSCGRYHLATLGADGCVYTMGFGECGRLGLRSQDSHSFLQKVLVHRRSAPSVIRVNSNDRYVPKRGNSASAGSRAPTNPSQIHRPGTESVRFRQVACGGAHTGAIDADLNCWFWGSNNCGQLGLVSDLSVLSFSCEPRFVRTLDGKGVCSIQLGGNHSLAITLYGLLYSFGTNESGQICQFGERSTDAQPLPSLVDMFEYPVLQVACGAHHAFVLSNFEHPSARTEKFASWKQRLLQQEARQQHKADQEFRTMMRLEVKKSSVHTSERWQRSRGESESRSTYLRNMHQQRMSSVRKDNLPEDNDQKQIPGSKKN